MLATDHQHAESARPQARGDAESWPAPRPLSAALAEVCPFDPELLPEVLRPWVLDLAERLQVPADYPAVALIVMLAGALGRRASIRPQRHDHWMVVPNLWVYDSRPAQSYRPSPSYNGGGSYGGSRTYDSRPAQSYRPSPSYNGSGGSYRGSSGGNYGGGRTYEARPAPSYHPSPSYNGGGGYRPSPSSGGAGSYHGGGSNQGGSSYHSSGGSSTHSSESGGGSQPKVTHR